jgi:Zn-dependent peptidase ImmA (M78 family)
VRSPSVDVIEIAGKYATVIEHELESDVSGALVPPSEGANWVILVNKAHNPNRKRFTVAHELGHLLLHGYTSPHADRRLMLRDARSSEGSTFEEIEANQFAAELLMPRELVLKEAKGVSVEYEMDAASEEKLDNLVDALAGKFKVSSHAMRIRLASLLT